MSGVALEGYLIEQALQHPSMEAQDVVKLCFQAAFGAEHILSDQDKALAYLLEEFEQTTSTNSKVFEPICHEYSRCNLAAWKYMKLPPEWLFQMFYHSASVKRENAETYFMEYLDTATACVGNEILPFNMAQWQEYKALYIADGVRPVHHSHAYRLNEQPAYRIVKSEYMILLPVLQFLAALSDSAEPKVLAIDGRAAAGKTTLAALLSTVLSSDVIHMDDFFLPLELRTKERLSESGGNIHYERFSSEVIPFLKKKENFSYQAFDCGTMDYGESYFIQCSKWRIVEGSYSCHPVFGDYMDCRIFCDVSTKEQMNRIVHRNGQEMAQIFSSKWIPMEEQYFQSEAIMHQADIIIR